MSNFGDNVWRLNTVQSLTVASASGAAVSTALFGAQTYAIRLCFPSAAASNAVRIKIGSLMKRRWLALRQTPCFRQTQLNEFTLLQRAAFRPSVTMPLHRS